MQQQLSNTRRSGRSGRDEKEGSDFEPDVEEEQQEEAMSDSDASNSPQKAKQRSEASSARVRRSTRNAAKRSAANTSPDESEGNLDAEELAEEAASLKAGSRSRPTRRKRASMDITYEQPRLRERQRPDYRIYRPETVRHDDDDDDGPTQLTSGPRRNRGGATYRSLFTTQGPFGMAGGPASHGGYGMPGGDLVANAGADSDSSDDDLARQAARPASGAFGMTPATAKGGNPLSSAFNSDAILNSLNSAGLNLGPTDKMGALKDKKLLADADPLGVEQNINFDAVGGLDQHINQLKEMVMLPLLYPEIFERMHIVPPRGVLFHGPPGTGKTLLARALASSVSSQGKKVTFYMRKGADTLSKWVGEAEKQLRTLFEEARRTQPSIIFFDEIDGKCSVHEPMYSANGHQVSLPPVQANQNKSMRPLSRPCSHSWTAWMAADKSLSSAQLTDPTLSTPPCEDLAVSTESSTSRFLPKQQDAPSSISTLKGGSHRWRTDSRTNSPLLPKAMAVPTCGLYARKLRSMPYKAPILKSTPPTRSCSSIRHRSRCLQRTL